MSDMFDYLKWRGDLSFYQSRFNAVDGLILSTLTFIDFDALCGGEDVDINTAADQHGHDRTGKYSKNIADGSVHKIPPFRRVFLQ